MTQPSLILLVEDNADDEMLTLRALRKQKLANQIDVVRDGAEALDYLQGQGKYSHRNKLDIPQIIMLDLKLPKINGLQVLEQIRAMSHTSMIPVVILTSSDEEQDIAQSYTLGANSYVRKPVDFEDFIQAVGQIGLYWLLVNKPPPH